MKNPDTSNAQKELLSQPEAARYLGVTTQTLRDYRKRGILHGITLSRKKVVFRRAEIEQMLNTKAED